MCFALRVGICGHTIETTERVECVGVSWRKWDPAIDVCRKVQVFQTRWPVLEQLCWACQAKREEEGEASHDGRELGHHRDGDDNDNDNDDSDDGDVYEEQRRQEHGSTTAQDRYPRGRAKAYAELTGNTSDDRHDAYDLQRWDSHESTNQDHVPALSRTSQSTWTSSIAVSPRSSADLATTCATDDENPRIRILSSWSSTSRHDSKNIDATSLPPLTVCRSLSLHREHHAHHHEDDDNDNNIRQRPLSSPNPNPGSSSPFTPKAAAAAALADDPRNRFARFLGWKQTKPPQHRRNKSDPRDMRPDKKTNTRNRWKTIVSRNKSVDSDKSFVCVTARAMQNREQNEDDPAFGGA
ncbi:hypothetical protein E4U21_003679 [Claviceps maximensis]|nr:hypothetical protein E4U21_003679 [Claviceps maximensis]